MTHAFKQRTCVCVVVVFMHGIRNTTLALSSVCGVEKSNGVPKCLHAVSHERQFGRSTRHDLQIEGRRRLQYVEEPAFDAVDELARSGAQHCL